jgi:exonuclease VII small subunit
MEGEMSGSSFEVDLDELRRLKKKLQASKERLEESLRRMKDTGPKNLGKRSLDSACEDFEDDWEHGLSETKKRIQTLEEGVDAILKNYEKTEAEIQKSLSSSTGGR